jgi:hypothetical protein
MLYSFPAEVLSLRDTLYRVNRGSVNMKKAAIKKKNAETGKSITA